MILTSLILSSLVWAEEPFLIHRMEPGRNEAVVASHYAGSIRVGDEFKVETPQGTCHVITTKVITDYFYVNTDQCAIKDLERGTQLRPVIVTSSSDVAEVQERAPAGKPGSADADGSAGAVETTGNEILDSEFFQDYVKSRLSLMVSYHTGNTLDGTIPTGNGTSYGDFKGSNTVGFGADYKFLEPRHDVNFVGGFAYSMPRAYGRYTFNTLGNVPETTLFEANPEMQTLSLFVNARYKVNDDVLIYGGINHLFVDMDNIAGDFSGDIGFQLGARYYPSPQVFVDAQLDLYNLDYELNNQAVDFSLTEVEIRGGYTF